MTLISLLTPIIVPCHPSDWLGVTMIGEFLSVGSQRNHGIYFSFAAQALNNRDYRSNDLNNCEGIEVSITTINIGGRCRFP